MNFLRKFNQPSNEPSESVFIQRAEAELKILAGDLKKRDWGEVSYSLRHTELNIPSITKKMSPEAQEEFNNLIAEVSKAFAEERNTIDPHLATAIQEGLDYISRK